MNASKIILGVFILIIFSSASVTYAQQQFTQTVTAQNKNCNATCSVIDIPDLNGNTAAVIFITPLGNTATLNPHPVGSYFMYLKKWSVFNLDGVAMPEGAKYNIEYYATPDANHFVYTAGRGEACIDHAGLNGNPNAQVKIFPTSSPTRGGLFNKIEVKAAYSPKDQKWCVANLDGTAVISETAYNIQFSGGGAPVQGPSGPVGTPVQIFTNLPISSVAPGLPGPLTVIAREVLTFPITQLNVVTVSYPSAPRTPACKFLSYLNPAVHVTDSVILTPTSGMPGPDYLQWSAIVGDGGVNVEVCVNTSLAAYLTGMKVNILVLR